MPFGLQSQTNSSNFKATKEQIVVQDLNHEKNLITKEIELLNEALVDKKYELNKLSEVNNDVIELQTKYNNLLKKIEEREESFINTTLKEANVYDNISLLNKEREKLEELINKLTEKNSVLSQDSKDKLDRINYLLKQINSIELNLNTLEERLSFVNSEIIKKEQELEKVKELFNLSSKKYSEEVNKQKELIIKNESLKNDYNIFIENVKSINSEISIRENDLKKVVLITKEKEVELNNLKENLSSVNLQLLKITESIQLEKENLNNILSEIKLNNEINIKLVNEIELNKEVNERFVNSINEFNKKEEAIKILEGELSEKEERLIKKENDLREIKSKLEQFYNKKIDNVII